MVYDTKLKKIDDVDLTYMQSYIVEELIKMNGQVISADEIAKRLTLKYGIKVFNTQAKDIRIHIFRINKRVGEKLIKNRNWGGYYIDENIKIC